MKLLFILLLVALGCDYAPTEHGHLHDHPDFSNGCCLQLHPSDITYTYIDSENGVEMSFASSGSQYYYFNQNQEGCLLSEAYEEYDEIVWGYIDNQTCDELCADGTLQSFDCFIDSVSILIPSP